MVSVYIKHHVYLCLSWPLGTAYAFLVYIFCVVSFSLDLLLQADRRRQKEPTQDRLHHHIQVSGTQQKWKAQVPHISWYSHRHDRTKRCWNQRSHWWWQLITFSVIGLVLAHVVTVAVVDDMYYVEEWKNAVLDYLLLDYWLLWSVIYWSVDFTRSFVRSYKVLVTRGSHFCCWWCFWWRLKAFACCCGLHISVITYKRKTSFEMFIYSLWRNCSFAEFLLTFYW